MVLGLLYRGSLLVLAVSCLNAAAEGEEHSAQATGDRAANAAPLHCPIAHPMRPALELAVRASERSAWVRDYTGLLTVRRAERGALGAFEYFAIKVRTRPLSVYVRALAPSPAAGAEMIFDPGIRDGVVVAHAPGWRGLAGVTLELAPQSPRFAAAGLPAPESLGCAALGARFMRTLDAESHFGECDVRTYAGAKVDGRSCTCIQVIHPARRANFDCHLARLYFDDETSLAVRLERYGWPRVPEDEPALVEEVTYSSLVVNPGLSDSDFDPANREYLFP